MTTKKELAEEMAKELQSILKNLHDLEHKVKTILQKVHREKYDDR